MGHFSRQYEGDLNYSFILEYYIRMSYSILMRKLSTKWFKKWSKKANLSNQNMLKAIGNLKNCLSTAELGGNLYKIRVKASNRGKSASFRIIVVYKKEDRVIFLYGFAKNEKANINKSELQYLKKLGNDLLSLNFEQLQRSIEQQILFDSEVAQ